MEPSGQLKTFLCGRLPSWMICAMQLLCSAPLHVHVDGGENFCSPCLFQCLFSAFSSVWPACILLEPLRASITTMKSLQEQMCGLRLTPSTCCYDNAVIVRTQTAKHFLGKSLCRGWLELIALDKHETFS